MLTQLEEDSVRHIVKDFMSKDQLFTALDISNEIKQVFPQVRHREVRDVVRSMFSDMEKQGWARADIPVTLADGTQQTALLYYPLSASWDLETLYDAQKRSQTSKKAVTPTDVAQAVVDSVVDAVTDPVTVAAVVTAGVVNTVNDVTQAVATNVANTAHDMWKHMFTSKPSLFPHK